MRATAVLRAGADLGVEAEVRRVRVVVKMPRMHQWTKRRKKS